MRPPYHAVGKGVRICDAGPEQYVRLVSEYAARTFLGEIRPQPRIDAALVVFLDF